MLSLFQVYKQRTTLAGIRAQISMQTMTIRYLVSCVANSNTKCFGVSRKFSVPNRPKAIYDSDVGRAISSQRASA